MAVFTHREWAKPEFASWGLFLIASSIINYWLKGSQIPLKQDGLNNLYIFAPKNDLCELQRKICTILEWGEKNDRICQIKHLVQTAQESWNIKLNMTPKFSCRGGCYIKASGKRSAGEKKMEKKKIHQIYQKMRSCQLSQCITAHANRDSHSAGTKRNHFLPRCVIKQWSRPPSWPGQRGMEWFGKPVFHCGWDYCAFLHYTWKGETPKDRECNLESKMNYLSSCRGKHLSSAVTPRPPHPFMELH